MTPEDTDDHLASISNLRALHYSAREPRDDYVCAHDSRDLAMWQGGMYSFASAALHLLFLHAPPLSVYSSSLAHFSRGLVSHITLRAPIPAARPRHYWIIPCRRVALADGLPSISPQHHEANKSCFACSSSGPDSSTESG